MAAHLAFKKPKRFLIDPRSSWKLGAWDGTGGIILIYTAIVTPYEVAFLPAGGTWLDGRFLFNRAIDLFFLCDMFVQLFVMYPAERLQHVELNSMESHVPAPVQFRKNQVEMISEHRKIALHYLSTWFLVDLISVLTGVVDIIMVTPIASSQGDGIGIEQLRVLRVLRVLRLFKLVRLLKTSRLIARWQSAVALDFSTQTLLSCIVMYLCAGHWFACCLVLTTTLADSPAFTWLAAKGYCVQTESPETLRHTATWELQPPPVMPELAHLDDVYCVSAFELWIASYYWMMQLISGSAGGETNQFDLTSTEQVVFTFLTICSCMLSSQIIASFCDVLSNLNPDNTTFRNRMDHLNRFGRQKKLSHDARRRLREYLIRTKNVQSGESQRELISLMSPKLQGELSLQVSGPWLLTVPFLKNAETQCAVQIALALRSRVYVPTELLPADCMYMVSTGMVVHMGRIYGGGQMWGTDSILCRVDLRSRPARALTYVEVDYIHREDILEVVHSFHMWTLADGSEVAVVDYPLAVRRARWYTVRLGIIREYHRVRSKTNANASPSDVYKAWRNSLESMDGVGHEIKDPALASGTDSDRPGRLNLGGRAPMSVLWRPPKEIQQWM